MHVEQDRKRLLVLRTEGQLVSGVVWLVDNWRIVGEGMEMLDRVLP